MVLPALISAGASLLGGLLGRKSQADANAQNIQLQKDFAQQGIQWKVEDARKAGIHPLYALGAQTASFAPNVVGDTSLPTALANAGQDISRAVDASRTSGDRLAAYDQTVRELQLTRLGLENDLLASQIAKINQAGHPPGLPASVGGDPLVFGGVEVPPNPNWSDAQAVQNRYGEPSEYVYAPFVAAGDLMRKVRQWLWNDPRTGFEKGR